MTVTQKERRQPRVVVREEDAQEGWVEPFRWWQTPRGGLGMGGQSWVREGDCPGPVAGWREGWERGSAHDHLEESCVPKPEQRAWEQGLEGMTLQRHPQHQTRGEAGRSWDSTGTRSSESAGL